jgi:hypothetical protein
MIIGAMFAMITFIAISRGEIQVDRFSPEYVSAQDEPFRFWIYVAVGALMSGIAFYCARTTMHTSQKASNVWSKLAFRFVLSCDLVVVAYILGIVFYGTTYRDYAYHNMQYYLLLDWLSVLRLIAALAGVVLLFWSYVFLRPSQHDQDVRYSKLGICVGWISLAMFLFGLPQLK